MNKLDNEEITNLLATLGRLEGRLETLSASASSVRGDSGLPDFEEFQKYDETAKVGYRIEDIEICLANIEQEISDANNHIDALKRLLGKKV